MRVLVIDDGKDIYNFCRQFIQDEVLCSHVTNYHDAEKFLRKTPVEAVLVDKVFNIEDDLLINTGKNKKIEGYVIAERVKKKFPNLPVIMISVHAPQDTAKKSIELGLDDFIEWEAISLDPGILLRRLKEKIRSTDTTATGRIKAEFRELGIIGSGDQMRGILERVKKIAPQDTHVLFTGETGVGKDRLANAVHYFSPRKENPFIDLNLSSIPETLVEDEIFGHERGAFTDAKSEKRSIIEIAGNGTVLFNEIGDLKPNVQVKLLKLIEDKSFTRLGGTKRLKASARFIFATNKDLKEMVSKKLFRKDLYYRISTNVISIPPLRERVEDIPDIVYITVKDKKKKITNDALDFLKKQYWEGNIRQLKSVLESASIMCDKVITVRSVVQAYGQHTFQPIEGLDKITGSISSRGFDSTMSLKDVEKSHITNVLERCDWYVEPAEKILQISRASLYRKIKEYGLKGKVRGYSQK